MAFGSYYSLGGQNADYTAGGGGLGGGGGAGGANLNSQLEAFSNFDPTLMMNALLRYGADQQRYGMERKDWEYGRAKRDARSAGLQTPLSAPARDPLEVPRQQAQMAQLQAMSRPLPSRMTSFPSGAINAPVVDDMRMTGAQRQMFLPQNSYFGGRG